MANDTAKKAKLVWIWASLAIAVISLVFFSYWNPFGWLATIFSVASVNDTTLERADNHGAADTWFHLSGYTKTDFGGHRNVFVLNSAPQGDCYGVSSNPLFAANSLQLHDQFNSDAALPQGMEVRLFWSDDCSTSTSTGRILVSADTTRVEVPDLGASSSSYTSVTRPNDASPPLGGHIAAIRWWQGPSQGGELRPVWP